MGAKSRVTQAQIAARAKVTQSVVSVILSGVESSTLFVSDETRARVLAIAEKMGYGANRPAVRRAANAPARRRSVLLVEDSRKNETTEPWVSAAYEALMGRIVNAAGEYLEQRGLGISVHYLKGDGRSLMQWLAESDTCGVLWHASERHVPLLHWTVSRYPMVALNRTWRSSVKFDSVGVDQELNIRLAAEHLWERGHRKIATFGHMEGNVFFERRMDEYRRFVREKGIRNYSEFQKIPDEQERPAAEKVQAILDTWKSLGSEAPTGIILSDVFALRLLGAARERGIEVPGDLSVIGIDNTTPCSLVNPPLTSMEEPFEEICARAVELLDRRIKIPETPSETIQISPRLISRESVATCLTKPPVRKSSLPSPL
jgi:LacI family transcriptional regulator